jgi:hypothetical protein
LRKQNRRRHFCPRLLTQPNGLLEQREQEPQHSGELQQEVRAALAAPEHRIADRRVVRLLQKWLRAGVLEDGKRIRTEGQCLAAFGEPLSSLRIPSVGPSMASEACARRCHRGAIRRRHRGGPSPQSRCRSAMGGLRCTLHSTQHRTLKDKHTLKNHGWPGRNGRHLGVCRSAQRSKSAAPIFVLWNPAG